MRHSIPYVRLFGFSAKDGRVFVVAGYLLFLRDRQSRAFFEYNLQQYRRNDRCHYYHDNDRP